MQFFPGVQGKLLVINGDDTRTGAVKKNGSELENDEKTEFRRRDANISTGEQFRRDFF